jgi:hypothetical protein
MIPLLLVGRVCVVWRVWVGNVFPLGLQGLKVVRMTAKSRESIGSSVEHLTLHYQVNYLTCGIGIASLMS